MITLRTDQKINSDFNLPALKLAITLHVHVDLLVFFLSSRGWNSHNESVIDVPVRDRKVPCHSSVWTGIALNLSTKKVGSREPNGSIDTFVSYKGRKVVVDNVGAVPSSKEAWLQHFQLVVAHLIITY